MYRIKYLKYKQKYLQKKMRGGNIDKDITIKELYEKYEENPFCKEGTLYFNLNELFFKFLNSNNVIYLYSLYEADAAQINMEIVRKCEEAKERYEKEKTVLNEIPDYYIQAYDDDMKINNSIRVKKKHLNEFFNNIFSCESEEYNDIGDIIKSYNNGVYDFSLKNIQFKKIN